jgi:hypothetical protein
MSNRRCARPRLQSSGQSGFKPSLAKNLASVLKCFKNSFSSGLSLSLHAKNFCRSLSAHEAPIWYVCDCTNGEGPTVGPIRGPAQRDESSVQKAGMGLQVGHIPPISSGCNDQGFGLFDNAAFVQERGPNYVTDGIRYVEHSLEAEGAMGAGTFLVGRYLGEKVDGPDACDTLD